MRALVTGAAGFIGSHLCERLITDGHEVVAVDKLTSYYDPAVKRGNTSAWRPGSSRLVEADVTSEEVRGLLGEVDTVFHLAAQPGVRPSWGQFPLYLRENVEVVHTLLETVKQLTRPPRIVLASSSSVYGDAETYPCRETSATAPVSPYGVSKLCMERLAAAYVAAHQVPVVSLRYFTVYGPRQRPDMAFHRFIESALANRPVEIYGDGEQVREYTYVTDVVDATVRAGTSDLPPGTTLNVCGGEPTSINGVIDSLSEMLGRRVAAVHREKATGDVRRTGGSGARVRAALGWFPTTRLATGLEAQLDWHRERSGLVSAEREVAAL